MMNAPDNPTHGFRPTRAAGLARLAAFVPSAGRAYAASRNTDTGPGHRDNVSVLSPWIRHRMVTETEVLSAVLGRHSLAASEKFVQEVFWRTYFKGHLETRPGIWTSYCADVARLADSVAAGTGGIAVGYRHAVAGQTGIDCFDAWVRELVETGYLHNHARMWFASIWIFTLKLPWQLGADFTLRHFVDGDPASNTLSWRWVGGLHTRGKTYLARRDNIATYTNGRFDPEGLATTAPALEEDLSAPVLPLPSVAGKRPSGRVALLLTEEDLHPESLDLAGCEIAAIAGGHAAEGRSPLAVSDQVLDFTKAALADTMARQAQLHGCPSAGLAALNAPVLADFCAAHGLDTVVTACAPVGPAADAIRTLAPELERHGIALRQVVRPFDRAAWPYATRGFFALRQRIPDLLVQAGIAGGTDMSESARAQGRLF